ncbi:MAG: hemerythrin domain-containing protein [Deltaproteobacteria bacterium]|nr:hemerythrin domain-containing protein [Deltaproteobacteria bacterium]
MGRTDNLRVQHRELKALLGEVDGLLQQESLQQSSREVVEKLTRISGILLVHLSMEDKRLYPKLLDSPENSLRQMASVFIAEMGHIGETFTLYVDKWLHSSAIENNSEGFIGATKSLSAALIERMKREDEVLYPEVDRLSEL